MIPARVALAAFVAFIAAAPRFLGEFQVTLMNYIGLSTMVALGLVLLTGVAGVMSFGQQVFAGIAAYTTAVLTTKYGVSPWISLFVGLVLVAVVALFLGVITLRLSGHYLPISTIAWGIAIYFLFGNMDTARQVHRHRRPAADLARLREAEHATRGIYYLIWAVALYCCGVGNLLDSRTGAPSARCVRAVMAESFGVDTARLKAIGVPYAALFAASPGWLYAHFLRFVSPSAFNVNAGIDYLFMAVSAARAMSGARSSAPRSSRSSRNG